MNFLFSYDYEVAIQDTIFPNFYPAVQANTKWKTLAPFQEPAIREYLLPFVGRPFYDALMAYDGVDETVLEAGNMMRRAIAYYMVFDAIPTMLGNLSALGFQSMSDSGGTSNGPSQWAYKSTRWNLLSKADTYLDQLLVFLDEQVQDEVAFFNTYANDPAVKYKKSAVFHTVDQLDHYLNIQGSRRAYNRIIPFFEKAEDRSLRPVLGEAFLAEVMALAAKKGENRTDVENTLVRRCRYYVAEIGLTAALPHLSCVIQGDGIVIVSRMDGFDQKNGSGLSNSQAAISRLRQDADERAKGALKDLLQFLATNAAEFPSYVVPVAADENIIIPSSGAVGIF